MKKKIFLLILLIGFSFSFTQEYWESILSTENSIHCFEKDSNQNLYSGLFDGLKRSSDGGNNWEYVLEEGTSACIFIDYNDNIYAGPAPIFFSSTNGDEWTSLNYPGFGATRIFVDSEGNIFVGTWGSLYKSSNEGEDWDLVMSFEMSSYVTSFAENSSGILFAGIIAFGGGIGGVYKSITDGDSWEHFGLEYVYVSSLALNSNDELFAGSRGHNYNSTGEVYKYSDDNESWSELCNFFYVTSIVINSEDVIFIGCSDLDGSTGAVHFSEDFGLSWNLIESDILSTDIWIEYLTISDDYLYAISYEDVNHIYRSLNSSVGVINYPFVELTDSQLSNYPNPFNSNTTIFFEFSDQLVNPRIEIFDIRGHLIQTILLNNTESNSQNPSNCTWNAKDKQFREICSGIYLYRIKASNFESKIVKMTYMK